MSRNLFLVALLVAAISTSNADQVETITTTVIEGGGPRYLGCFVDSGDRVLPKLGGTGFMTLTKCATMCSDAAYFGLQYGNECWCGSNNARFQAAPARECNMQCSGESSVTCGGTWRNSIYATGVNPPVEASGARFLGCFVDSGDRVLPKLGGTGYMSVAKCLQMCNEFPYFGLQYSNECWCGNSNTRFTPASALECNMRCTGDSNAYCGGTWRNSIYATGLSPNVPKPRYLGCFIDSPNRVLPKLGGTGAMTTTKCSSLCNEFPYFGLQYGNECWCGSSNNGFQPASPSDCNMRCSGDSNIICGGTWRNSIYAVGGTVAVTPTMLGCFVDSPNRVLPKLGGTGAMTIAKCFSLCSDSPFFGLQYGNECWCGSSNARFQIAPASECNMLCSGDNSVVCGGTWRNNIYSTGLGLSA